METIFNRPVISQSIMDNFTFSSQHCMDLPNLMEILPSPPDSESQDSDTRFYDISSPEAMVVSKHVKDTPILVITEQPVEKFRFRYKSEMAGTHGCLNGKHSDKSIKVTYPSVELRNYSKPAIIRCSLYTAPMKDTQEQFLHPHRLMRDDDPDPHNIEVGPDSGYEAVFSNMGIIHTARKYISEELKKKKERLLREKRKLGPKDELRIQDTIAIKNEITEEVKRINLNTVTLCFEGFERRMDGLLYPICDKVFSDPINNSKSAMTGELKICRMDKAVSPCSGGEEIFMFVEKVIKKNIEVRFFEINNETEDVIWTANGIFNDLDVHHQYAIALKTPPYRDQNITSQVQVYIELYRPSDGDRSEPRAFRYKPNERSGYARKRKRLNDDDINIPTTIASTELSTGGLLEGLECMEVLEDLTNKIDSKEFISFLKDIEPDSEEYSECLTSSSSSSLTQDGIGRHNLVSKKVTSLKQLDIRNPKANVEYNKMITQLKNIVKGNLEYNKIITQLKTIVKENTPNWKEKIRNRFILKQEKTGDNILHMAIKDNQEKDIIFLIQLLDELDDGKLVNTTNNSGETALHSAVELGNTNFIKLLMKINANPNIADGKGDTVFHTVLKSHQHPDLIHNIVKILCEYSTHLDFDLENDDGLTAVHLAVRSNNLNVMKLLIGGGADVNHIAGHNGDNALHMAVQQNNIEIVEYLLKHSKININQQNFGGYTALHTAVAEENTQICRILRAFNADPNIPNNNMCIEIKQENDEDDDDDGGMTSVQLALHNKDILNILKTEPEYLQDIKIDIKDEEIDTNMYENKPNPVYTDELVNICDKTNLWEKLAEFFGCESFIDVYRNLSSPTRALINYKKIDVTLDVIEEFKTFLQDPIEISKINEIIGRLKL